MWFYFFIADTSTDEKSDHSDRNDRRKDRSQPTNKGYLARNQSSTLYPVSPPFLLSFLILSLHFLLLFLSLSGLPVASSGPHRVIDKLFNNTRYFVIKSNNYENVDIAKDRVGPCTCVQCTQYSSNVHVVTSNTETFVTYENCKFFQTFTRTNCMAMIVRSKCVWKEKNATM